MIKIAWSPKYHLSLPESHRFPMAKYSLLYEQLLYEGTVTEAHFFTPKSMSMSIIAAVHDGDYMQKFTEGSLAYKDMRRIGFPWSRSLVAREEHIVFGTVQGALYALEQGMALNIAGGTHHAFRDHGEGFCMFNDIAVAAQYLLDNKKIRQALVVDLDVHQGNGTARIFEREPRVFTFSMHGEKNYPLHKETSDLDIPLEEGTGDKVYLNALRRVLPGLIDKVKPDIIFYQTGVDILNNDKLGRLAITREGIRERDIFVLQTAFNHQIPVMAAMGGGYAPQLRNIVDAHCNTFRVARDIWE
jgi:acetoin utilization deacetylase AcuC-like enzyme